MFNYNDKNFRFKYLEYQSLEFSETTNLSNLTSVLAFYVNIILGLDFASFSIKEVWNILLNLKIL